MALYHTLPCRLVLLVLHLWQWRIHWSRICWDSGYCRCSNIELSLLLLVCPCPELSHLQKGQQFIYFNFICILKFKYLNIYCMMLKVGYNLFTCFLLRPAGNFCFLLIFRLILLNLELCARQLSFWSIHYMFKKMYDTPLIVVTVYLLRGN